MPEFPTALWDGNPQNESNDGAPDPTLVQARDYNETADEVIAVQDQLRKGFILEVKNETGGTLGEGVLVRITGVDAGDIPKIDLAKADLLTTLADGVTIAPIDNNAIGNIATNHLQASTTTGAFGTPGTQLFLSAAIAGAVTATAPTNSQQVGIVVKQDAAGKIYFNMAVGTGGSVPTTTDKAQNPSNTSGDNQPTGVTVASTPANDGYVGVIVNGVHYEVGDSSKLKDCYFSNDGGTTARAIADIVSADQLIWNGVVTGFDLLTTDEIDFDYNV